MAIGRRLITEGWYAFGIGGFIDLAESGAIQTQEKHKTKRTIKVHFSSLNGILFVIIVDAAGIKKIF